MNMYTRSALMSAAVTLITAGPAVAAFENDGEARVDDFSEPAPDTTTWVQYAQDSANTTFEQDNGDLQITADLGDTDGSPADRTDYVTISETVGIGEFAQVELTPNDFGTNSVGFAITNDSANQSGYVFDDSNRFIIATDEGGAAVNIRDGSATGGQTTDSGANRTLFDGTVETGTTYVERISYVDEDTVELSFRDANGDLLTSGDNNPFTYDFQPGGDVEDELKVGLYVRSAQATFDNVRIAPIPEPASLAMLGLGGGLLAFRRRRSA